MKVDSKGWCSTNKTQKDSNLMICSWVRYLHQAESWHRWAGRQEQDPGGKPAVLGLQKTLCQQHQHTDFNWMAVSSRKEDLFWDCSFGGMRWREVEQTRRNILGVLWEKGFANRSKGKMLLVFPSVLRKGCLKSAMIFDKLSKSLRWLGCCQSIFLSPHTKLFNSSYFNNPNNKNSSNILSLF